MKYILNFDLSILNIFQLLKINGFVNYLLLNKYGNVFQYEVNILRFYLLKINWKWILEIGLGNRIFIDILGIVNSLWNL